MAEEVQRLIFLDSSVLIEYFKKTNKQNSFFYKLQLQQITKGFLISGVVQLEIYKGVNAKQKAFWDNLLHDLILVPFSAIATLQAIKITQELKLKRRTIELGDLIIAATASALNIPLATINTQHFTGISVLNIITPESL